MKRARDQDGALTPSERDVMYLGPLLFAAVSWVFVSLGPAGDRLWPLPDNSNIFSWWPTLLAIWWFCARAE